MNRLSLQGMTTEIEIKYKNGKHKDQNSPVHFPSISVGSVIPRRVALQQSPLAFHRTIEINRLNRKNKQMKIAGQNKSNYEDIWPNRK
jgi:hypothetical protein